MTNPTPQGVTLRIGGKYNWKNQPERLVYLGENISGNGYWHQFALIESPTVVWCEVKSYQLDQFEESYPPAPEQPAEPVGEPVPQGWISVAERMPEPDSGEVLVWLTGSRCAFDEWHTHREDPTGMGGPTMDMGLMWRDYEFEEITHWMPLPAEPEAAKPEKHCMNCAAFGECLPNNDAGRCGYEPEQQAQAGEPSAWAQASELVETNQQVEDAIRCFAADQTGDNAIGVVDAVLKAALQSHHEVMEAQRKNYTKAFRAELKQLSQAIAKKDAALKACVEALKSANAAINGREHTGFIDAAITQAEGALK